MTGEDGGALAPDSDRRRDDRRGEFVRLADYTIPELRKALLTGVLLLGVAAAKAGMLNFYWMFLALITGVYTFGLVGIIIGPILIGVLKAVFESVVEPVPLAELADRFDPLDRGTHPAR